MTHTNYAYAYTKPDFDFNKIRINDVGKYSITRPYEAKQIVFHMKTILTLNTPSELHNIPYNLTITDATAGVGGDTLHFSKHFKHVNAVDILEDNIKLVTENCKIFGVTNVSTFTGDYTLLHNTLTQDIVYLDPPWGGIGYKKQESVELYLSDTPIHTAIDKVFLHTKHIFLKLPLNANTTNLNIKEIRVIYNKKNVKSFYLAYLTKQV